MNTIRSVGYGWVVLIAAGGGAYYFAKKSINEDRATRAARDRDLRMQQAELRAQEYAHDYLQSKELSAAAGALGNPSMEANALEPAATQHAPVTDAQRIAEKSKYEASEVWRSKKGDRFS